MLVNPKVFSKQNKFLPDMQKIRYILLGCGHVAKRHLDIITESGELIAVCDTDEITAKNTALQYGVPFYTSLDQLIQNTSADVAVVCTPNGLHATHTISLLENGFHVLVEKPMALSVNDARRMMETAQKHQRHLFTVLQNRFNPAVEALYRAIQQNELGKLFSVQVNCFWNRDQNYYVNHAWHGNEKLDGGVLFTQFSHFIDLLHWCFGAVEKVSAITHNANHQYTALQADEGAVLLQFENGMIGTLQFSVNSFRKNMEGSLTLFAEKGTIKIGGTYLDAIVYAETAKPLMIEPDQPGSALQKVYQSMIRTLQSGDQFYTSPEESLESIMLIEHIYASAKPK
ncbi:MAG TPA: gfo/Idh/MocA family oxidoreductase [Chitinophagaceae bacterium]|nr:gfo/Idh/MocA family oxidoreductase [Chitinophagaceae bacterium]